MNTGGAGVVIQGEKHSGDGQEGKQKAQNNRNFQKWFSDCANQVPILRHT